MRLKNYEDFIVNHLRLLIFVLFATTLNATAKKTKTVQRVIPIPINDAESVVFPLWDHELCDEQAWTFEPTTNKHIFDWDALRFKWRGKMLISTKVKLNCEDYDYLIFHLVCPRDTTIKLLASGQGRTVSTSIKSKRRKFQQSEFILPLQGLMNLDSIRIELNNPADSSGYMRWIGLGSSKRMKYLEHYRESMRKIDFHHFVKMPSQDNPKPGLNIFCGLDRIKQIRQEIAKNSKIQKMLVQTRDKEFGKKRPEQRWDEYVTRDHRWARDRDFGKEDPRDCINAAWAGMLLNDKNLLLLAAKRAVVLAMIPNWGAGMYASLPGSSWEHRAFGESFVIMQLAFTLDFCNDFFTEAGRDYLLRRIAEKGLGTINFNVWKWDYMFYCNQLSAFSCARVIAYIVLEKSGWKHVRPYTDLAIKELNESIFHLLAADGGYSEGPGYYQYTLSGALPAYYCYAKARNRNFTDILPQALKNAGNFAELASSSDKRQIFIPFNDSGDTLNHPFVPCILEKMLPDSQFVSIYNHYLRRFGTPKIGDYWSWILGNIKVKKDPPHHPFVFIPSMASMASFRQLNGSPLKIAFMADTKTPGHKHQDAGQFIIELDGNTLAMDSGSCSYASPSQHKLQLAAQHNVMVPVLADGTYGEQQLIRKTVSMQANGNDKCFSAAVDLRECWDNFFVKRRRELSSSAPETLIIKDEWQLKKGKASGVAFLWLTNFPIQVQNHTVTIRAGKALVSFDIPPGWTYKVDTPRHNVSQQRLALICDKEKGSLQLNVHFAVKSVIKTE